MDDRKVYILVFSLLDSNNTRWNFAAKKLLIYEIDSLV